jgi:protein tyrosine/serine phosphatase
MGGLPMIFNTHWAKSIQTEGIPNLYKVSEDLYRSGQPTAKGMRSLNIMGIRTVVSLRSFYSDLSKIGGTELGYEHIRFKTWHPEERQIIKFLYIVTDNRKTPVLVHCQHGADRTGTMCAIYRIAVEGWTKEDALKEMTEGGFGFHGIWGNLTQWIGKLDIDKIKKAGIRENTEMDRVTSDSLDKWLVASTILIKSNPPGTRLQVDGQSVGEIPYFYTNKAIAGAVKTVTLRKEGYKDANGLIRREKL